MTQPYLTVLEYRAAPTAIDSSNLIAAGNQAVQDAELGNVIRRASGAMDNFVDVESLVGSLARPTLTQRTRVNRRGEIRLRPRDPYLVSLSTLSYGLDASNLLAVSNLSGVWVDEREFVVPAVGFSSGSATVQLGPPAAGSQIVARYTYVAGWPNTVLTGNVIATATSLPVASTLSMQVGQYLTIADADKTEDVVITGITSSTVVAVSALVNAHTAGTNAATAVAVHAMPHDVKEAAILYVSAFITNRGSDTMAMNNSLTPGAPIGPNAVTVSNIRLAQSLLSNYRRVR